MHVYHRMWTLLKDQLPAWPVYHAQVYIYTRPNCSNLTHHKAQLTSSWSTHVVHLASKATMAMSSNLSLNARSLPDSPAGDLRPASLLSKMASRGRRPSQLVTSTVLTDEAPATMSPGSVVGDMERGTLAEKSGRSDGQLTSRWRELHGSNDWQGLLDPIDTVLHNSVNT